MQGASRTYWLALRRRSIGSGRESARTLSASLRGAARAHTRLLVPPGPASVHARAHCMHCMDWLPQEVCVVCMCVCGGWGAGTLKLRACCRGSVHAGEVAPSFFARNSKARAPRGAAHHSLKAGRRLVFLSIHSRETTTAHAHNPRQHNFFQGERAFSCMLCVGVVVSGLFPPLALRGTCRPRAAHEGLV